MDKDSIQIPKERISALSMYAINFYSESYTDQLLNGRKTATIRLGDHTNKYVEGQIVYITVGQKYGHRQKLFEAVIDTVDMKFIKDLTRRDIIKENPEFRRVEEVIEFMTMIYDLIITPDDLVTVVHFSKIVEHK